VGSKNELDFSFWGKDRIQRRLHLKMHRINTGDVPREREKGRRRRKDVISDLTLSLFFYEVAICSAAC
jgi:hypothetical protein